MYACKGAALLVIVLVVTACTVCRAQIKTTAILDESHPYFGFVAVEVAPSLMDYLKAPMHNTNAPGDDTSWLDRGCRVITKEVADNYSADIPGMVGSFLLQDDIYYFSPKHPFIQDRSYACTCSGPDGPVFNYFTIPELRDTRRASVVGIWPSSPVVPANILKLYVTFSTPMVPGQADDNIRILDKDGQVVMQPFINMDQELWDAGMRRITIWFDPGRIKRGLIPNLSLGNPLQPDSEYTIVISKGWKDQFGNNLKDEYSFRFRTAAFDYEQPDIDRWTFMTPKQEDMEEVIIVFDEHMDMAMLQSSIVILDREETAVPGDIDILDHGRRWVFTPHRSWAPAPYSIWISKDLEDLAGNSFDRLFDKTVSDEDESDHSDNGSDHLEYLFHIGTY